MLTTVALAHREPIAIMIDDARAARPQSGMSSASIVYQAPADGSEDRYMMIFQEGTAKDIGAVRSARRYFVYWAAEYKAVFGHYGQDGVTLRVTLPSMAKYVYNMDALGGKGCAYHRISTRVMPHNAYTNTSALYSCAAKYHFPATFQGLPTRLFTDGSPAAGLPAARTITLPYPTGTIGYVFDSRTDSYGRSVAGKPQIDAANKKQVYARNVIVMFQQLAYYAEPGHGSRPLVSNVGSGRAIVFQNGRAIAGTWRKPTTSSLTRYYDAAGNEIPLVRGEIFIQSVPLGMKVTYK